MTDLDRLRAVVNATAIEALATSLSHIVMWSTHAATGIGEFFAKLATGISDPSDSLKVMDDLIDKQQKKINQLRRLEGSILGPIPDSLTNPLRVDHRFRLPHP